MSGPTRARALYLIEAADGPVFGFFHGASEPLRSSAVLICPPFGWEDVCSYRGRRDWAERLATAGYPTLRIDLPGTGDSGEASGDHGRLDAWTDAVSAAATWLRRETDRPRVTAVGIGLGGLLICRALAAEAPIDDVVLWGTPSRGRTFVRELRAFARLESSQLAMPGEREASPPDGGTEAGGFLISAETSDALEDWDVATLSSGDARIAGRALLLGRDGIEVDARLHQHLERAGAEVTVAPGEGYGAMMAEPQLARPPIKVFAQVESWLGEATPPELATPIPADETTLDEREHRAVEERRAIELTIAGGGIRESPLTVEQACGQLFGILAEPIDVPSLGVAAVVLNAGAIRHTGPSRMWVEIARRWAARGVPTLRLDLEGIGDADGDDSRFTELAELYVLGLVDQVRAALDVLEARGVAERFVLLGLCSGAYWSFHGALQDDRVSAAFMLNPQAIFWDASQETVRDLRKALLRRSSWLRLLRGEAPLARLRALAGKLPEGIVTLARRILSRLTARSDRDELDRALQRLGETDKRVLWVFSGEEPLHEELKREGRLERLQRWPHVELDLIPGRDHTLRPTAARRGAHAALDDALERELARAPAGARSRR